MIKELLIIFVIAIVFIVDCGYTVETECKSLLEDEVSDLIDMISPEP